jgi:hypothetical protein
MELQEPSPSSPTHTRRVGELSYKFQRLRERLRQAIVSGELSGKLPGERILARKYNCNAKTLSKALTDLAAEGLLDRSIGRGTYVRGSAPAEEERRPWLVLGDGGDLENSLFPHLLRHNPRCQLVVGAPQQRPSFVNQFSGVVDLSGSTPDAFLRDLVVRGVPVVVVGREPRTYSVDSVLLDVQHGVSRLARELLAVGHTAFAAVESGGHTAVTSALRQTLHGRDGIGAVDTVAATEVLQIVNSGATALVCDGPEAAAVAVRKLREAGIAVPERVSVVAVGIAAEDPVVTGYYVPLAEVIDNATRMLGDTQSRRPAALWLAPVLSDRGTWAPPAGGAGPASDALGRGISV